MLIKHFSMILIEIIKVSQSNISKEIQIVFQVLLFFRYFFLLFFFSGIWYYFFFTICKSNVLEKFSHTKKKQSH